VDKKIIDAVKFYWISRNNQKIKQGKSGTPDKGSRGAVTGGAQMDALADLVSAAIIDSGIPADCIFKKWFFSRFRMTSN